VIREDLRNEGEEGKYMVGHMRRIVTFNWVTANGYFAGPDGSLRWVAPDDEQAKAAAESILGFDTVLFGRRTYELFEGFWEHRAMAIGLNEMTKVVFSRTLREVTWNNSRLLRELDPREIERMKTQPGKDMIIFGSGSIVSQLTRFKLIDEYQFVVCPIFLGSGRPLLGGVTKGLRLELLEAKEYRSGGVMLRYTPELVRSAVRSRL
jgi:dihydrofolate reductase